MLAVARAVSLAILAVAPLGACAAAVNGARDAATAEGAVDADATAPDPPPDVAPPVVCGDHVCPGHQLCVEGCCRTSCETLDDGGACPPDMLQVATCHGPNPGCLARTCDNPVYFCVDVPAECAGRPTCGCLPRAFCGPPINASGSPTGHACREVAGRVVRCSCSNF